MVSGDNLGLYRAVGDGRLFLALGPERKEAVGAIEGQEDTRGAAHGGFIASEVGVREQSEV